MRKNGQQRRVDTTSVVDLSGKPPESHGGGEYGIEFDARIGKLADEFNHVLGQIPRMIQAGLNARGSEEQTEQRLADNAPGGATLGPVPNGLRFIVHRIYVTTDDEVGVCYIYKGQSTTKDNEIGKAATLPAGDDWSRDAAIHLNSGEMLSFVFSGKTADKIGYAFVQYTVENN